MEENDIYSISAINNLIDKKISYCDDFKKIKIRGEITNFNGSYNSGHYYFSLKDKNSSISCVMFKLSTKSLDFEPKNGVDVVASGEVSFYKVRGNLQFRVRKMQEAGLGDLYIAFEKLKKKLDKEGLFKDKKVIPQYPKKIGVITSASGKAIKDIVNNIEKRWPAVLPSSVRRYRRPLWASSLMQTIRLCSFKSVSTLLTCFIPTPDSSLIFVGILTSFFKVSSTFRL